MLVHAHKSSQYFVADNIPAESTKLIILILHSSDPLHSFVDVILLIKRNREVVREQRN